jgi:serine/threonine-protein kinase
MTASSQRLTAALSDRYRLERELGAGGMATVFLAEDLKHQRRVAIKVLHPELSAVIGGERFLAEIKVTANLQHPHILPLFDSGAADGLLFYVMPYVQGESLRAKMSREKQLGVEEAVRLATQVASALDYAHRQGVVHRDIKPENVLLHDGVALVADFGIALAASNAGASRMTATGMSLGTPAYMSPEQAMGDREVDARSDVYSLATMLYEMLVGDPPHSGSTAQAIVAKVLTEKPVPITVHRDTVPSNVAAAVQKALAKLPADRFASAADFAKALTTPGWSSGESLATLALPSAGGRARTRLGTPALVLGGLLIAALAGAAGWLLKPAPPGPLRRYLVLTEGVHRLVELSPDGSMLVATGPGTDSAGAGTGVWLQRLDQLEATRIPGLDADGAVFSPDGKELAIDTREGKLQRVPMTGAAPTTLADSTLAAGWWGDDGNVYFTHGRYHLARVPAGGGPVERLTTLDPALATEVHLQPQLLPSGKAVLFTSVASLSSSDANEIKAVDLQTKVMKSITRGSSARYAAGRLVFVTAGGTLVQAPFDESRLELTGTPELVTERVATDAGLANVAISRTGTLMYQVGFTSAATTDQLSRVSRDGRSTPLARAKGQLNSVRLAPDGRRLAYEVTSGTADGGDLYVLSLDDTVATRLTRQGINTYPAWSPDGRRIAYSRLLDGVRDLAWQAADGSGRAEPLLTRPGDQFEVEFAPDGRFLVREGNASAGGAALDLVVATPGDTAAAPFAADSLALERAPRLSPDGRWLAFITTVDGRDEVVVRPYPDAGTGAEWQVSDAGGTEPVWARSGRELFYKSNGALFSAEIRAGTGFSVGARRRLFHVSGFLSNPWHARFDVLPGDTAFVMIGGGGGAASRPRTVVVENWARHVGRGGTP